MASAALLSSPRNNDTGTIRKSAEISRFPKSKLPPLGDDLLRDCANLILSAFPARSAHAACLRGQQETGVSYDTLARIVARETRRVDLAAMLPVVAVYVHRTGRAAQIAGLAIRFASEVPA